MDVPHMALLEQRFDPQRLDDVERAVTGEIAALHLSEKIKPGDTVAITAGSRGIANIVRITATVVRELQQRGAQPLVFPSMGSHGGATAAGQLNVLARLGMTEETLGCPILSDMEPVYLGDAALDFPIFIDRHAMTADHIVVINRIKAHTKFKGPCESGLMKMMAIGMGKQRGASYYHQAAVRLSFPTIIETVGLEVLKRCPILFGLGIVENAFHETCLVKALSPGNIHRGEQELLDIAKQRMARLPFDIIDLLIIDQIGKDISGTWMDTNVTGRNRDLLGDFTSKPRAKRVYVRDLTDATEGNATGIGLADFTTSRLVNKMDRKKTYINAITGISPEKAAIPMFFDSDREAIEAAFHTIGDIPSAEARIVHIRNTSDLHRISVSAAYRNEIEANPALAIRGEWRPLTYDCQGNLAPEF